MGVGRFIRLDQPGVAEAAIIVDRLLAGAGSGQGDSGASLPSGRSTSGSRGSRAGSSRQRAILAVLESLGEPEIVDREAGLLVVQVKLGPG